MAEKILASYSISQETINNVKHCILTHRSRGSDNPKTTEAKILFDADKLDAIGAIGIGRTFMFAGSIGARLHNPEMNLENTYAYTKEDTAYREFMLNLRFHKDRMLTKEGKRLAEARHDYMIGFFIVKKFENF